MEEQNSTSSIEKGTPIHVADIEAILGTGAVVRWSETPGNSGFDELTN